VKGKNTDAKSPERGTVFVEGQKEKRRNGGGGVKINYEKG